jgi:hypothetical protein
MVGRMPVGVLELEIETESFEKYITLLDLS